MTANEPKHINISFDIFDQMASFTIDSEKITIDYHQSWSEWLVFDVQQQ